MALVIPTQTPINIAALKTIQIPAPLAKLKAIRGVNLEELLRNNTLVSQLIELQACQAITLLAPQFLLVEWLEGLVSYQEKIASKEPGRESKYL